MADADVLMNLLATSCPAEILRAVGLRLLICPTISQEAIYLEGILESDEREQIDLFELENEQVLNRLEFEDREIDMSIDLARLVDDGEAEVLSVAVNRGIPMASDDRKARRVALERGVTLLSTPELLHNWQNVSEIPVQRMRLVLNFVHRRSRYRPPPGHSLYAWWMSLLLDSQ